MNIERFKELVKGGQAFTVSFRKKDGSERIMNARLGVKKHVKGSKPEVTAKRLDTIKANNMVGVFEMRGTSDRDGAENYRTINLDTLNWLKVGGAIYED